MTSNNIYEYTEADEMGFLDELIRKGNLSAFYKYSRLILLGRRWWSDVRREDGTCSPFDVGSIIAHIRGEIVKLNPYHPLLAIGE